MTRSWAVAMALGLWSGLALAEGGDLPILQIEEVRRIADPSQGFNEPSGLALASDDMGYWSVSDGTLGIFRLSPEGVLMPDLALPLQVRGLEGVVEDQVRGRVLAVQEEGATIVSISLASGEASVHPLSGMSGFDGIEELFGSLASNKGLEGITLDTTTDEVVVVKERQPRLMIRISPDLSTILGTVELTEAGGFACDGTKDAVLDVSDITYDAGRGTFWLLSDEGSCVVRLVTATGQMTGSILPASVDHPKRRLKNPEGIALNREGTELRVVTDDGKDSRIAILSIRLPEPADEVSADQ